MAEYTVPSVVDGWFKRIYADGVLDLIKSDKYLQKTLKFKQEKKVGDSYEQPVITADEQGITFGGTAGTAFTLNSAISSETGNARVKGCEMTMKGRLSRALMTRSMSSEAAFGKWTKKKVENLVDSHTKHLEGSLLYGRSPNGLATIESQSGSGTTRTFVISAATWNPGWWLRSKGMNLDCHTVGNSTKLNSNAAIVVTSITLSTRSIVVSGNATDLDAAVANKILIRTGSYTNDIFGLDAICEEGTTLFELAVNEVWSASKYDIGSTAPSMTKVLEALDQAFEHGAEGDCVLVCPNKFYTKLNLTEAALRKYDVSYRKVKAENGVERLIFVGHSGELELVVHRYVKHGEAFLMPKDALIRIGSFDGVQFTEPTGGPVFYRLESVQGFEMRSYTDQALFPEQPNAIVKLHGAVY